jgi:hypothetical protein
MPDTAGTADTASDAALLSSLASQLDDLIDRVTAVAERYAGTPDAAIAVDLFATERALTTARRALERARSALA